MTLPQASFRVPLAQHDDSRERRLLILGHSGLFNIQFYLRENVDLLPLGPRALAHYHENGWREGRRPNPCFDPLWYIQQNPDVVGDPLYHYIVTGEAAGLRPVAWFDPAWYRQTYAVPEGMLLLTHYLTNRHRGDVSPVPEFDPAFYLRTYPDVAEAGLDPAEHYMIQGFREVRKPFPAFDPQFYRARYLANAPDENPLLHYVAHRNEPGVHPALPAHEHSIPREVARNTRPSPLFEDHEPLPPGIRPRARVLAYYLPQFHPIAENDLWWGKGFTEWHNVARGLPRFVGHYQPRIPRDLGHYTLTTDVLRRQIAMAQASGIEGFVYYFYWFNGRRLLEKPLDALMATPDIAAPFCLMWANENWTRTWDGSDKEILIAQNYDEPGDLDALCACLAAYMADPRYIRVAGRPLLMIYRPGAIPEARAYLARLRAGLAAALGVAPVLVMAQAFGDDDPAPFGLDAAVEFPPHGIASRVPQINANLELLDPEFDGQAYDYRDVVDYALATPHPAFPLIRTASPSWDNDARREGRGLVLHGSTPALYEKWLGGLIEQARETPFLGEAIVCVNAWNEWAEGAYLEPDQHFGSAYLNATARACTAFRPPRAGGKVLLVGHDAFPSGAQMLLLAVARAMIARHGACVRFVLLGGGTLLHRYQAVAPVCLL
ncbi:glycoside hydrolase family 99-like domain-containing protein, partial [Ameyamaea chiangmaiensis]